MVKRRLEGLVEHWGSYTVVVDGMGGGEQPRERRLKRSSNWYKSKEHKNRRDRVQNDWEP